MTQQYGIQSDVRRHFVVTGTYIADESVSSAAIHRAIEKTLIEHFADPVQIMTYGTPKYHHPYAVDVRQQFTQLTPEQFEELSQNYPYLMTALLTFVKGAFVPEISSTVVEVDMPVAIEVKRERP